MELRKAEEDENPVCPCCKKELGEIVTKKFDEGLLRVAARAFFCPHCRGLLTLNRDLAY